MGPNDRRNARKGEHHNEHDDGHGQASDEHDAFDRHEKTLSLSDWVRKRVGDRFL